MKYHTVVIDPPWKINMPFLPHNLGEGHEHHTSMPYDTMTDAQIIDFPIDDFADDTCNLFMWTTHAKLPDALEIIKAWRFKYAPPLITWLKGRGISSRGWHYDTEFLIRGTRGKSMINQDTPYTHAAIHAVIPPKQRRHSAKPDEIYHEIARRTPAPRIDIFARRRHAGFDAYGDQVEPIMQEVLV